uniref:Uncharacterized protein n=1 Tax=Nothobranchius furzeri TaxID=105023 RepID=A0A8C6KQN8_NOTFU
LKHSPAMPWFCRMSKRAKLEYDRRRQRTRINIGPAFEEWKMLRKSLRMKTHPQLASFLLKRAVDAFKVSWGVSVYHNIYRLLV